MQVFNNIQTKTQAAQQTILVSQLTNGLLDPALPMLGPVTDGGIIVANTELDECSLGEFPRNLYGL